MPKLNDDDLRFIQEQTRGLGHDAGEGSQPLLFHNCPDAATRARLLAILDDKQNGGIHFGVAVNQPGGVTLDSPSGELLAQLGYEEKRGSWIRRAQREAEAKAAASSDSLVL